MHHWSFRLLLLFLLLIALIGIIGGGFGTKEPDTVLQHEAHLLFAHRAGTSVFPENSSEGVEWAMGMGYRAVELDVNVTKDDRFVLFHDDSCYRQLRLPGTIDEYTLDQIQAAPLYRHGELTEFRVPALDSILARFGQDVLIYLDCKFSGLAAADRLAESILQQPNPDHVLVASSSVRFLVWMEYRHPKIHTVLEGFDSGKEWTYPLLPVRMRPDLLSSFAHTTNEKQVAWLSAHGLLDRKIVYSVDSAEHARLHALGISRFIVDDVATPAKYQVPVP